MDLDELPLFRMQKDPPLLQRRGEDFGKLLGIFHDVKAALGVFVGESLPEVGRVHFGNRLLGLLDFGKYLIDGIAGSEQEERLISFLREARFSTLQICTRPNQLVWLQCRQRTPFHWRVSPQPDSVGLVLPERFPYRQEQFLQQRDRWYFTGCVRQIKQDNHWRFAFCGQSL